MTTDVEQLLLDGNELFLQEKFDEAISKYKQAIDKSPNYIEALNNYGQTLSRQNKNKEAIEEFKKVISIDPNYVLAYRNLGLSYSQTKQHQDAIEYFKKALQIEPLNHEILNDLGNSYLDLGKYDEAINKYRETLQIKPDFVYSMYNWGIALERLNNIKEAVRKYKSAIKIDPEYINAYQNLAALLFRQENYNEAANTYKALIKRQQTIYLPHLQLARTYFKLSRYDEAADEFLKAISLDKYYAFIPEELGDIVSRLLDKYSYLEELQIEIEKEFDPDNFNKMGNLYFHLSMFDEAIVQYKKIISKKPDYIYAHHNIGLALNRQHKFTEAIEYFHNALKIDANYIESVRSLAEAYYKTENYEKAAEEYKKNIKLDPGNNFAYVDLANSLARMGKSKEAVKKFIEAIDINPREALVSEELNNLLLTIKNQEEVFTEIQAAVDKHQKADVYNDWGNIFFFMGKYERAIGQYNISVKLDENFVYAYHNLGLAYFNLKQYNKAIEQYKKAIIADSNYASTYYNYAFLLDRKGEYRQAFEYWEKASEAYEHSRKEAIDAKNPEHFLYYGDIVHSVFNDYSRAEEIYKDGLSINENYIPILLNMTSLYLDIKENTTGRDDDSSSERIGAHWNSWEYFKKAEAVIQETLEKGDNFNALLDAGDLYLIMGEYEKACEILSKALEQNKTSARVYSKLAIAHFRLDDFKKAIKYFEYAIEHDPDNLIMQSNLAEAYLKNEMTDKAETLYKKILEVTQNNVESHIGLGEIYTVSGDKDDTDMYPEAVASFTRALNIAQSNKGSKKLKKRELAAVYYSRGYARVKQFEAAKLSRDESVLKLALEDFKKCYVNDPDNHKAKRAQEKIEKSFSSRPSRWLAEKFGPAVIFAFSFISLLLAQFLFFVGKPVYGEKDFKITSALINELEDNGLSKDILTNLEKVQETEYANQEQLLSQIKTTLGEENFNKFKLEIIEGILSDAGIKEYVPIESGYYVLLTFGALLFMITGLYLPQVLKLKVGGIELEKSAVDQIKTSVTLGISKKV